MIHADDPLSLASYIDHTILKPDAGSADVERFCAEALRHRFKAVCINPAYVPLAVRLLKGSGILTCTVVGFPLGAAATACKAYEAGLAVAEGADEIDMVMAVGALKEGNAAHVRADIAKVKEACGKAVLKVILETCLLDDEEKATACRLSQEAGADFVKTSTGFGSGGATVGDVALMRKTVGTALGVKASGGIRRRADALAMIEAGAVRIGSGSGVAIVEGESRCH